MIGWGLLAIAIAAVLAWLFSDFRIRDVSTIDGDESRDAGRIGYGGGREL